MKKTTIITLYIDYHLRKTKLYLDRYDLATPGPVGGLESDLNPVDLFIRFILREFDLKYCLSSNSIFFFF